MLQQQMEVSARLESEAILHFYIPSAANLTLKVGEIGQGMGCGRLGLTPDRWHLNS